MHDNHYYLQVNQFNFFTAKPIVVLANIRTDDFEKQVTEYSLTFL